MDGRACRYLFSGWSFDPVTGDLEGPGGACRLPPKPSRLLALLLERPGELVTREEIRAELWTDQHLDVDQALAYTLRQVRGALGDDAARPDFVETLPRRGYRFLGQVERAGAEVPEPSGDSRAQGRRVRRRARLPAAVLVLAALAPVGWLVLEGLLPESSPAERSGPPGEGRAPIAEAGPSGPAPSGREPSEPGPSGAVPSRGGPSPRGPAEAAPVRIALLPLTTGSGGSAAAAASVNARLTEALLVALAEREELDVVGPATTAAIPPGRSQPEIGAQLDVAFVASGGYRPQEGVFFLQLIRASDGGHAFARRLEGGPDEILLEIPALAEAVAELMVREGR